MQKINDARWQRPDMQMIRGGLAANGLGTMVAGCLGALAIGTTSGSVGASVATGVTSRVVGFATGALFIVFAFFPTIHDLLIVIPRPVMGATLVFSSCFINVTAMQVMTSRLMDARRTLVIGGGLLLAFSRFLFPGFYADGAAPSSAGGELAAGDRAARRAAAQSRVPHRRQEVRIDRFHARASIRSPSSKSSPSIKAASGARAATSSSARCAP